MAEKSLNKRFFTNTYITGSGRQNYLRTDYLEDPLFTSFTFDIDFVASPLFYTINYSDYGYPNVDGMGSKIEQALSQMYGEFINIDKGYDILPALSASILDGNKLGFGLQQNVFMDMPLYGAAEYIYMVDKRNSGAGQNDARFDNNRFVDSGGNPNVLNSYKLGDSIKGIVNDSDRAWVERKKAQNDAQIKECEGILAKDDVKNEHANNLVVMNTAKQNYEGYTKIVVEDKEYSEEDLQAKVEELKKANQGFEDLKNDIVKWANGILQGYQRDALRIYNDSDSACAREILAQDVTTAAGDTAAFDKLKERLAGKYGENYVETYIHKGDKSYGKKFNDLYDKIISSKDGFLTGNVDSIGMDTINPKMITDKFGDRLKELGLYKDPDGLSGSVKVYKETSSLPEWAANTYIISNNFLDGDKELINKVTAILSYRCDINESFGGSDPLTSDEIKKNEESLAKHEVGLDNLHSNAYGMDEQSNPLNKSNPSPDSPYGEYLEAKDTYENDRYSQAEKAKSIAESGASQMQNLLNADDHQQNIANGNYNESLKKEAQPLEVSRKESIIPSQTVLDMLGFISGMKKMTMDYPYIIQGISGLDTAYNKHYGVKDSHLGSGDDKITLTCLESLDLRVSSMFNRYFNAVYDRQYRRERVPVNLRRFNCTVYVHDVRSFYQNVRKEVTYNKIVELADMYYSVVEFRFYDCEIVPEETGNIFNDISNEAPSEMKKTNFTFTYGNCVVNFVPKSELSKHNYKYFSKDLRDSLKKSGLLT